MPTHAANASTVPDTTGNPAGKPVSADALGVTPPITSPSGERRVGNFSPSRPMSRMSSRDHGKGRPEGKTVTASPVSMKLIKSNDSKK